MSTILITGGAGFIGSHLAKALGDQGRKVRVLDALVAQVHGSGEYSPPSGVEFIQGDVRDRAVLERALDDVETVFHLAAEVGVGQSMYEAEKYVNANTLGTTTLLQCLIERRPQVRKLVVASSMSLYGEGAYGCGQCGTMAPPLRAPEQFERRDWELHCPGCDSELVPCPTPEDKPLNPTSVYAVTKQDQEQLCLLLGRAYGIPTVALRYFNVYGPGQALSNPYTGVAAIFSSRLLNRKRPMVYEDGLQSRDFVHVTDVVQANIRALEAAQADYLAINVGTALPTTVRRVAELLARGLGIDLEPEITEKYREGDIRHCIADISRARALLGYEPSVALEDGIPGLIDWVKQQSAEDSLDRATQELNRRGLVK